ncbi:MAG TPA: GPP34 family phosphoprotein [Longimicrobiales bacterium]|nr:GPP34 family phosphoprotein [Longimicrobiales bacterium]
MAKRDLFLHEELMLLALKDREGTVAGGTMYPYAIGGGVLAELLMSERIALEERKRKQLVRVVDDTPAGDPLIDEWIVKMADREKPRSAEDWVGRIAHTKDLKHRVARQLSRRGVLRTAEDKVLWIFTRKIYPELDPRPERELMGRLEAAIFGNGEEVGPRTTVVIALAHRAAILRAVFEKARLEERKERLERIAEGELTAEATEAAIEAMRAAVMVAVVVPTMVAASTTVTS